MYFASRSDEVGADGARTPKLPLLWYAIFDGVGVLSSDRVLLVLLRKEHKDAKEHKEYFEYSQGAI